MGTNEYFESNFSNIQLDYDIRGCDVNKEYLVTANDINQITVYSFNNFSKLFSYNTYSKIIHIQFHPKYFNIFSVTLINRSVHLFFINKKSNTLQDKVKYLCSKDEALYKTIFSPYTGEEIGKKESILATITFSDIKIWDIRSYHNIFNIHLSWDDSAISNYKIKWSQSGRYLIFHKSDKKIEIFSLDTNAIKYHLDFKAKDFYFLEKTSQLMTLSNKNIIFWDLQNNTQNKIIYYNCFFIESIFDYNNLYIHYLDEESVYTIYDLNKTKQIFNHDAFDYSRFFILNNKDNNPRLFSKIIFRGNKDFHILTIDSKKNISHVYDIIEEATDDFWEKSIDKIHNDYDYLSHKFNYLEDEEIHKKKYMDIEVISEELKELSKKNTLEDRRQMVIDNMTNFKENENINTTYLFYLQNLIRDNTNDDLLKNYLAFLKKYETLLSKEYGINFENYFDESNHYQVCFKKNQMISDNIKNTKNQSEKEKLITLLNGILLLKDDNENILKNFIASKKQELDNFIFNQPISFKKNEELYYCRNKTIILYNLEKMINNKRFEKIKNMKYCIEQILNRHFFEKDYIIKDNILITFIITLIAVPQKKIITDYNLNLIDDQEIDTTEDELIKLGFLNDKSFKTFKKDDIIIKADEIKSYNLKNIKLYINLSLIDKTLFQKYELKNIKALKEYYKSEFDEDKIRLFLKKILVSNVFKEAFAFLYGNDIKYPFINEEKAKSFLDNYLKFIPMKNETINAITEKFSMEIYIFLNPLLITSNLSDKEKKYLNNERLIYKALTNSYIISIYVHEINQVFHNYYYCSINGKESLKAPRRIEMNEKEGGNNMERILFGRVMNEFTLPQALFILNEKNYNKALNQFRKGFLELKEDDCKCEGIFNEYSSIKTNIKNLSDYYAINFKFKNYGTKFISIRLKDDVIGFPNLDDNYN